MAPSLWVEPLWVWVNQLFSIAALFSSSVGDLALSYTLFTVLLDERGNRPSDWLFNLSLHRFIGALLLVKSPKLPLNATPHPLFFSFSSPVPTALKLVRVFRLLSRLNSALLCSAERLFSQLRKV